MKKDNLTCLISRKNLIKLYNVNRFSLAKIAKLCNTNVTTVFNYFKRHKIATRTCATSVKNRKMPPMSAETKIKIGKANRRGIFKNCLYCHSKFYSHAYRNEKFCSKSCANKFRKTNTVPILLSIRNLDKYKEWRLMVFGRDYFECQSCNKRGIYLEAHHKKALSTIVKEQKILTVEQALNCQELWDVSNGLTLCKKCHKKTENFGWKMRKNLNFNNI